MLSCAARPTCGLAARRRCKPECHLLASRHHGRRAPKSTIRSQRHARRDRARDADDGAIYRDQGRQSRTACCSTGWAISTNCSSTTPRVASRALGIVLTKRGKHLGGDIPMCGVPVERADEYLHRLIALGHRVAVCEQIEDPAEARKRGNKSVVRRDVVRLVTPGTLTEDTLLDAKRNNYLLAIARARAVHDGRRAVSRWPGSTFRPANSASPNASRLALPPRSPGSSRAKSSSPTRCTTTRNLRRCCVRFEHVTPLTRDVFDGATAERRLADYFAVATSEAFGALSRLELTAAAACITYVERTQIGKRPPLSPPLREAAGATLAIDQATRANLELMRTLGGERRGSLLAAIDRTVTAAGSRLLAQRLAAPLTDAGAIARRLDAVAVFVDDAAARGDIRDRLARGARSCARSVAACRSGAAVRAISPPFATALAAAAMLAARLAGNRATYRRRSREAIAALARPAPALAGRIARSAGRRTAAAQARRRLRPRGLRCRARRDARAARRVAPRDRRVAGALRRGDRRPRAEDPAQQRARLFRRGHRAARRQADGAAAQRALSSIARRSPGRCASPRPSLANWKPRSPAPPNARSVSSLRSSSGCRGA